MQVLCDLRPTFLKCNCQTPANRDCKRWHAPAVKKYHNSYCKKYKKKNKKPLDFCAKC